MAPGAGRDLGSATIDVRVRGRLADPASLSVSQKIDFRPPRQMPPAVARLRGDFIFRSEEGPGPIKHQRSFAHGMPGPGLRSLIDELLAKLRSVDAIGEEEYRRALGEPIVVAGGRD